MAGPLTPARVHSLILRAADRATEAGIRLVTDAAKAAVQSDEYGQECIETKVPYRGALRMPNPPNIQFHLSADEELVFPTVERGLMHGYADADALGALALPCYALEEVLTEKLRAVAGQRRYAVARDLYDIAQLVSRGVDTTAAIAALPEKAKRKGLILAGAFERFRERREEFRANWQSSLAYLATDSLSFDDAFEVAAGLLGHLGL